MAKVFLEFDESQIEGRVVLALTGDAELFKQASTRPHEWDMHTHNAALIFGLSYEGLKRDLKSDDKLVKARAKEFRYFGKRGVHGAQRDMRGRRLSETLILDGVYKTPAECDRMLEAYHASVPQIRTNYFRWIRGLVMRDRLLLNSWGRRMDFRYDRLGPELFRQAYSFLPQSECADLLNQRGVIPVHRYFMDNLGYPPNLQVHDSMLCSVEPNHAYDLAKFVEKTLEYPIPCGGFRLVVPVTFKLGSSWECEFDWDKLPSREEFTEAALACERKVKEREGA